MALTRIDPTTASGPGWFAVRMGRIVTVEIDGWDGTTIQLPWSPSYRARSTLFQNGATSPARCNATTDGRLSAFNMSGNGALLGQITYVV